MRGNGNDLTMASESLSQCDDPMQEEGQGWVQNLSRGVARSEMLQPCRAAKNIPPSVPNSGIQKSNSSKSEVVGDWLSHYRLKTVANFVLELDRKPHDLFYYPIYLLL